MKKLFFLILFFILILPINAEPLKASATFDEPLKGFFGTWHVTSKIDTTNNFKLFNQKSVDIWNLSGQGNVLILENALSGAKSSIQVENSDNLDGKKLKFTRRKEFKEEGFKYVHTETPEFILDGNIFRGYDTFRIEKFDLKNNLVSVDVVKYKVIGQKIAGD